MDVDGDVAEDGGERVLEEKVNWRRSYWVTPVLSVYRAGGLARERTRLVTTLV